jgi:NADPH-dependent 2,4-dienoyl-CoA reductase/sulfur reductase-like enzyme
VDGLECQIFPLTSAYFFARINIVMSSRKKRAVAHVQLNQSERYLDGADVVIVGNGIAGLVAAIETRRHLPDRPIVIITDQLHPTIHTPALKQFAIAKLTREQLLAYPAGTEWAERIHVVNAHVEEIQAQSKYIGISGNRCFGYGSLLIATGSTPVGLPDQIPGCHFDGVMSLHRLEDYLDLRRRLPEVREAVVIGGGAHACETVMGLLHWGIRVHWLLRSKTFMARMLDQTGSEMVLNNVRRAGAIIHTETEIKGIVGRVGAVAGVVTDQSQLLPCQLVLTCTGTQPAVTLAQQCSVPMQYKNGILVDDKLRTSVRDIYAAGDVAALRHPQTGTYETRAQWYAAVAQGRIAGAMMAGHDELSRQPLGVPWHATQLGELSMLTVGEPLSENRQVMILTDTSQGGYRRLAIADDRLVGYLSVGTTPPDSLAIKQIIDQGEAIGNLTNALLKGNFDAHISLSQQKSHAVKKWITGQLLAVGNQLSSTTQTHGLPHTDPVVPVPQALPVHIPAEHAIRPQEEQSRSIPTTQDQLRKQRAFYEEELNPFTGNLPIVFEQKRDNDRGLFLEEDIENDPEHVGPFIEDIGPFSGNLPAIDDRLLESQKQSAKPQRIRPTRKLLAYVEEGLHV